MRIIKRLISSFISVVLVTNSISLSSFAHSEDSVDYITDKITEDLHDVMNSTTEDIPVTIWLSPVESPQIEMQVKKQIGFDINEIESSYVAPSNELLNELANASKGESDEYLRALMDNHLELTESSRKIEKEKTDLYLETKRELLRNYYVSQASCFLDDMNITDDSVCFISKYAPMIICNISADTIYNIAKSNVVESVSLHQEIEEELFNLDPADMPAALNSIKVSQVRQDIGLNGDGVKIGIFEAGVVSTSTCQNYGVDPSRVTVLGNYIVPDDHPTTIAGIAAGTIGVAPGTLIYSASSENTWESSNQYPGVNHRWVNLETMIDYGVNVFNFSFGGSVAINNNQGITNMYVEVSKYLDYLIEDTGVTIVCADGNPASDFVSNVASSFNCISVNGYVCKIPDTTISEEILNNYSYDSGDGCIKPDVISPSLNGGTSNAAPFICGIVALLYQYKPSLEAHPEVVKSILLASCHRKCLRLYIDANNIQNLTETMAQGLTDRQGAGIPDIYIMISIVARHSYGFGELNSGNNYNRKVNIIQPKYGATNINVSMAYLHTNVPVNQPTYCDDYDISLSNANYNNPKESLNSVSSTEMIYANLSNDSKYELEIKKYTGSMTNVKYGYAWSTDNTVFYPYTGEEGIYFLKNVNSGKYLTMYDSILKAYQTDFSNTNSQIWILKKDLVSNNYRLISANGNDKNLEIGDIILGSYHYAIGSNTSTAMTLSINDDGTTIFKRQNGSYLYGLGIYNNSSSSYSSASWYPLNSSNKSQQWYLEAVEYKKGDVNRDGILSYADASLVLTIYSHLATGNDTSNNLDKYLADYNNDGYVDAVDASAISANL